MITLNAISKRFGGRTLFEEVTLTFNQENRYGLTGPNGSGKSTLFKIIMGVEEPTSGTVTLPKRVGFLRQDIEAFHDTPVVDTVIMGNKRLWKALKDRDALLEEEMTDAVGMRLGELEEAIMEEDGYSAESNAEFLLQGMGIGTAEQALRVGDLPTDMQFRVLLCQALFGQPDALLLDEPTNHLDLEAIRWLEQFLKEYQGVLVVVSHDRHFLNAVTTHIADIDYETVIVYPGNYDDMLVAKTAAYDRTVADAKSKEKKIAQLREFVSRFGAGTRASQATSRLREIDRLQPQELKKSNITRPYVRFDEPDKPSGRVVFQVKGISKSFDNKHVIRNLSMEIEKNDKIGVIGNNGRGKTTLLRMLAGVATPDKGSVVVGHQVSIGYFPQNHNEIVDKTVPMTAFEWLRIRRPGIGDQEVRNVLGRMLFGGDDAFKMLSALSGGETARLILAGMMLMRFNTLILDEPNNHLDLESVSALSWGLTQFPGTVILAAHDRTLIDSVATKIVAFEASGIQVNQGGLEDYLAQQAAG